jgi:hypothetical protein
MLIGVFLSETARMGKVVRVLDDPEAPFHGDGLRRPPS